MLLIKFQFQRHLNSSYWFGNLSIFVKYKSFPDQIANSGVSIGRDCGHLWTKSYHILQKFGTVTTTLATKKTENGNRYQVPDLSNLLWSGDWPRHGLEVGAHSLYCSHDSPPRRHCYYKKVLLVS
jgi:hypothetical protein